MKLSNHLIKSAFLLIFFLFGGNIFAQGTGTVHFQSEAQTMDARNKVLHMEGDAVLTNDSMELRAKHISIHSGSSEGSKNFSGKSVESLLARENVRILREGVLSQGTEALYTAAKGELLLKGPITISGTDFKVTGAEVIFWLNTEAMDVKGSKEKPSSFFHENKGSPVTIYSTSQKWNTQKNEVLFSGNILAKTDTHTLRSEKLLVSYRKNEEKNASGNVETSQGDISIDTITATGKVRISEAQGTGTGDKAVFTGNNDTIVLTGNPAEVTYQGHIIRGPQIRMNQKTGEMEASGGALGHILPKGKK